MDIALTGIVPVIGVSFLPEQSIFYLSIFLACMIVYSYGLVYFRCKEIKDPKRVLAAIIPWVIWAVAIVVLGRLQTPITIFAYNLTASIVGVFLVGAVFYYSSLQLATGCFSGTSFFGMVWGWIKWVISKITGLFNPASAAIPSNPITDNIPGL